MHFSELSQQNENESNNKSFSLEFKKLGLAVIKKDLINILRLCRFLQIVGAIWSYRVTPRWRKSSVFLGSRSRNNACLSI